MKIGRFVALSALAVSLAIGVAAAQTCPGTDANADYECPIGPLFVLPGWGNVPWSLPQYYTTIRTGDLDGDGIEELVGRDAFGVRVWSWNAATATWQPVLNNTGGNELVLTGLSDAQGWVPAQYSSTIQLADVDGQPGHELVARGYAGLLVYKYVKGPPTNFSMPTAAWSALSLSGPFGDTACFSNGKCWNAAPYYQTIRFGDIDGQPGAEAVGWGGNGVQAFKWNGSGWNALPSYPGLLDAGANVYSATAFRVGRIDNTPKAKIYTLTADPDGLHAYEFTESAWQIVDIPNGFFDSFDCNDWPTTMSCAFTLQAAVIDESGVPTIMARQPGCSSNDGGWAGVRFDPPSGQWVSLFLGGPFDDCSGFALPFNFLSIQSADLTGDGQAEVLARGTQGIVAFQWNGTTWSQIVTNVPALTGTVWATDPSYYLSVKTAKISTTAGSALLARGQNGVRTWTYANGSFNRALPYGSFTPLDSATYDAISTFLNLANGVRDLYVNPSIDNTSSYLRSIITQIINIGRGCQNEIAADPPQYAMCDPLSGTSNPVYTQVANQLIKELWLAANVVDHFTTLQSVQTALFSVEGAEFPSIADNLLLPAASSSSAAANYLNLFGGILQLIGAIIEQPEISIAGTALSTIASTLPFFQNPSATTLDQTFAQIAAQIAQFQQTMQANLLTQKHLVLGDYGMLGVVGQLVGSQIWTIDEAGYLSANRQAFTRWVYQSFTPQIWSLWNVSNCANAFIDNYLQINCSPPPLDGLNIHASSNGGASFMGLLDTNGSGCAQSCSFGGYGCTVGCTWATPDTTSIDMVFTPVAAQCVYTPGSGNAWVYGTSGSGGCTLGAGTDPFDNVNGWNFQSTTLDTHDYANLTNDDSRIEGIGRQGSGHALISALAFLPPDTPDLRDLRFTVKRLAAESFGQSELVLDLPEPASAPLTLGRGWRRGSSDHIRMATPRRSPPEWRAEARIDRGNGRFDFRIEGTGLTVIEPSLCIGTPKTARLRFELEIESISGNFARRTMAQTSDWICATGDGGNVTELRPLGTSAVEVASPL